jgi:hypothetical protein
VSRVWYIRTVKSVALFLRFSSLILNSETLELLYMDCDWQAEWERDRENGGMTRMSFA